MGLFDPPGLRTGPRGAFQPSKGSTRFKQNNDLFHHFDSSSSFLQSYEELKHIVAIKETQLLSLKSKKKSDRQ